MNLRKGTIWLSALFAVVIPLGYYLVDPFPLADLLSRSGSYFLLFSLLYVVGALIARGLEKAASLIILLIHSCCYFAWSFYVFLTVAHDLAISDGQTEAGMYAFIYTVAMAIFISPFFGLAAIITEIVLRYKGKHKEDA